MSVVAQFDILLWLALGVVVLYLVQRRLHFETQAIFLIITRRADITIWLFSVLFFPGVLLHEISHWVMARLLGVRTGRLSLFPDVLPDGRIQMGSVETQRTDIVRDALIGAAPLITGSLFVAYSGLVVMGLGEVWNALRIADFSLFRDLTVALKDKPDIWVWLYLSVAVSSTMLPSQSDRRAWLPITLIFILLGVTLLLLGAGPWLTENIAPTIQSGLQVMSLIFGISIAVQMVILIPVWVIRLFLRSVTNTQVI